MNRLRSGIRLHIQGIVQGVGFRPFVHRLAARHGLAGWVRNTGGDVEIAAEGEPTEIREFVQELRCEAPPLARIDRLEVAVERPSGLDAFAIGESVSSAARGQLVPPDVGLCEQCERELLDPDNRRFRYPFITCTDCGPRYSVIEAMPYDRARTSMRAFAQCPTCRREYETPGDRRYHSETNSCPVCGPRLSYVDRDGQELASDDPILLAARAIDAGAIVAIRGIGGFHLAVDAGNEHAVARLRARKGRDGKPFAVMVRSLDAANRLGLLTPEEADHLASPNRPIVIVRERVDAALAPSVSCGLGTVGVMLAYTPLHMLLLDFLERPLVMTSGNPSGVPLAASLEEARSTLGDVVDGYLTHDREIVSRVDDSVVRVAASTTIVMRRGRGYAPLPVVLPVATQLPLVAVGPHLKNTFVLAHGDHAFVSPHIGDLESVETEEHWSRAYAAMRRLFGIEPRVAVRDLHPEYLSTHLAERLPVERVIAVQHHHAHIAAVAAEHGVQERVIGVAFDGTGYGSDGCVWGAEILVADLASFRRAGHLRYAPLPGGDRAARSPWRVALGYQSLLGSESTLLDETLPGVNEAEWRATSRQLAAAFNSPLASSMGRLFDAAAAVLGIGLESRFEGEAAMRLEQLADGRPGEALPFDAAPGAQDGAEWIIDPLPLLTALAERRRTGRHAADSAADFHASVAVGTAKLVARIARDEGIARVVLGGGVFQNARLLMELGEQLRTLGLDVLVSRALPPNDGGLSYGQAAIAAATMARE